MIILFSTPFHPLIVLSLVGDRHTNCGITSLPRYRKHWDIISRWVYIPPPYKILFLDSRPRPNKVWIVGIVGPRTIGCERPDPYTTHDTWTSICMPFLCHVKNSCSSYLHSRTITFTSEHPIFHLFYTSLDPHRHSIPETVTSIFFILHNPVPLWLLLRSSLSSMYTRVHTVNSYDHFICTLYDIHWTWVWYLMWTGVVSV